MAAKWTEKYRIGNATAKQMVNFNLEGQNSENLQMIDLNVYQFNSNFNSPILTHEVKQTANFLKGHEENVKCERANFISLDGISAIGNAKQTYTYTNEIEAEDSDNSKLPIICPICEQIKLNKKALRNRTFKNVDGTDRIIRGCECCSKKWNSRPTKEMLDKLKSLPELSAPFQFDQMLYDYFYGLSNEEWNKLLRDANCKLNHITRLESEKIASIARGQMEINGNFMMQQQFRQRHKSGRPMDHTTFNFPLCLLCFDRRKGSKSRFACDRCRMRDARKQMKRKLQIDMDNIIKEKISKFEKMRINKGENERQKKIDENEINILEKKDYFAMELFNLCAGPVIIKKDLKRQEKKCEFCLKYKKVNIRKGKECKWCPGKIICDACVAQFKRLLREYNALNENLRLAIENCCDKYEEFERNWTGTLHYGYKKKKYGNEKNAVRNSSLCCVWRLFKNFGWKLREKKRLKKYSTLSKLSTGICTELLASLSNQLFSIMQMQTSIPKFIIGWPELSKEMLKKLFKIVGCCINSGRKMEIIQNENSHICKMDNENILHQILIADENSKWLEVDLIKLFSYLYSTGLLDYYDLQCFWNLAKHNYYASFLGYKYERRCCCGFEMTNPKNPEHILHCIVNHCIEMRIIPCFNPEFGRVCSAGRFLCFAKLKLFIDDLKKYMEIGSKGYYAPGQERLAFQHSYECKCECGFFDAIYNGHPNSAIHHFCNFLVINGLVDPKRAKENYTSCCPMGRFSCASELLDYILNDKMSRFQEITEAEANVQHYPCFVFSQIDHFCNLYYGYPDGRVIYGTISIDGAKIRRFFTLLVPMALTL